MPLSATGAQWKQCSALGVGVDIIYDGCAAGGLKHTRLGHRTIRVVG